MASVTGAPPSIAPLLAYLEEIGTTVSHAVDAIEMVFARLDATIDRTGIITAMRKARKTVDRKITSSQ